MFITLQPVYQQPIDNKSFHENAIKLVYMRINNIKYIIIQYPKSSI